MFVCVRGGGVKRVEGVIIVLFLWVKRGRKKPGVVWSTLERPDGLA